MVRGGDGGWERGGVAGGGTGGRGCGPVAHLQRLQQRQGLTSPWLSLHREGTPNPI